MAKPESVEFYVSDADSESELVAETNKFRIIRSGLMRIRDTRNGKIYQTTKDLINDGITEDDLKELKHSEVFESADDLFNDWLDLYFKLEGKGFEHYDYDDDNFYYLSDALKAAKEIENDPSFYSEEFYEEE